MHFARVGIARVNRNMVQVHAKRLLEENAGQLVKKLLRRFRPGQCGCLRSGCAEKEKGSNDRTQLSPAKQSTAILSYLRRPSSTAQHTAEQRVRPVSVRARPCL